MTLRVLLVAENASTRWGGEAILPFHYFRVLLERGADVQLIVHERCREEMESHFPTHRNRLHFIPDHRLQKVFHRISQWLPHRVAEATFGLANQMITQFAQRRVLRRLIDENTVIHQPIPVAPRFPSAIFDAGAPVVIGPMNGGMQYPAAFRRSESHAGRVVLTIGRALSNLVQQVIAGKRKATVLLAANERTRMALGEALQQRVIVLPENGVDLSRWTSPIAAADDDSQSQDRRFVYIGRLVDWKALDIALAAIAEIEGAQLDVIGDGPMRTVWQGLAIELGLAGRVRFLGWLPQEECATRLSGALALLLPSLYECGGAVVLEAMACAKPVIATAWGGPLDYLNENCGFLVAPTNRESLVSGFRDAMQVLLRDQDLGRRMGAVGRARVEQHFDWESKVNAMMSIYESTLASPIAPVDVQRTVVV